jgi:hypothetical protein
MPIQQGRTQAAPKKQHIVKTLAAALNKSKKRKRFFLFLDLKRHRYATVTPVAWAKRYANLGES